MSTLASTPVLLRTDRSQAARDRENAHRSASLSRRRLALLSRIRRRYQTAEQELRIGELRLTFPPVAAPGRVLDEVAAEADRQERLTGQREAEPLHLPYWAELWDSALGVAQFLARAGAFEPGSVVEQSGAGFMDGSSFGVSPSPPLPFSPSSP